MSNHKTSSVMPMVKRLIKSDLLPLIEQVLCKRAEQYLSEIESSPVSPGSTSILEPTYYVGHPDGSYSVADPQPSCRHD
jgi:hypothetical protein